MTNQIYLDYNATSPLDREVAERMHEINRLGLMNPASQHQTGQAARRYVEAARKSCLKCLDANISSFPSDSLVFTSGGTEANNLAILGLARKNQQLLISSIEHPSVAAAAEMATTLGVRVRTIPVNSSGVIRLEALESLLQEHPTSLVSVMLVNNETGVIQPVAEVAECGHRYGALVHTDAVQAIGKIPVSFKKLGVDLLTFTPHKFYGPRGIGGLVLRAGVQPLPRMFGGFQQAGVRPGTEDATLAVGCQMALEKAVEDREDSFRHLTLVRDTLWAALKSRVVGPVTVNGDTADRSPHTLNIAFPGADRQTLLLAADVAGLAFSTGSACSSGSSEPSPVLLAMGLDPEFVEGSIRLSFGRMTTLDEATLAGEKIADIVNDLRQ